ncbi:cell division control 48 [Pelomyxa schiedti]|nr:cell division control 48 [Pelomyxa schiedti]
MYLENEKLVPVPISNTRMSELSAVWDLVSLNRELDPGSHLDVDSLYGLFAKNCTSFQCTKEQMKVCIESKTLEEAESKWREEHPEIPQPPAPPCSRTSTSATTSSPTAFTPTLSAVVPLHTVANHTVAIEVFHHSRVSHTYFSANPAEDTYLRRAVTTLISSGDQYTPREVDRYAPVQVVRGADLRGAFSFDPLEGLMEIFVRRSDGGSFSGFWRGRVADGRVTHTLKVVESDDPDIVPLHQPVIAEVPPSEQSEPTMLHPREPSKKKPRVQPQLPPRQKQSSDQTLTEWVDNCYALHRRPNAESAVRALEAAAIFTIEQLLAIPTTLLQSVPNLSRGDCAFLLEQRVMHQKMITRDSPYKDDDQCKEIVVQAKLHRVRRYLHYYSGGKAIDNLRLLDPDCVRRGIEQLEHTFKNPPVIAAVREFMDTFTCTSAPPIRGMLLYGPPGTGKTLIIEALSEMCGLVMVEPIMMAAELNRGIVGETEKLIHDIFCRALKLPYLPCLVCIDEIDSAVPKRDESGSGGGNQHAADKVAAILGLIGGGTDVANLYIIGGTNRREAIDTAIQRRLPKQIYVGYPDRLSRFQLLDKWLITSKFSELLRTEALSDRLEARPKFFSITLLELIADLTLNFSGAALRELCNALMRNFEGWALNTSPSFGRVSYDVSGDKHTIRQSGQFVAFMHHARDVSTTFNLKVGSVCLVDLLSTTTELTTETIRRQVWIAPQFVSKRVSPERRTPPPTTTAPTLTTTTQCGTSLVVKRTSTPSLTERRSWVEMTTGLIVVRPNEGLLFQCEVLKLEGAGTLLHKFIPLRPLCPDCKKYAVDWCVVEGRRWIREHVLRIGLEVFPAVNEEDDHMLEATYKKRKKLAERQDQTIITSKVDTISTEDILREVTALATLRGLCRVIYVELSSFILHSGANTESKYLEEFTILVKQAIAPGSRCVLVLDMDSLAGAQWSSSEGSFGSRTFSIGNRQLFDLAVSTFLNCRRRISAESNVVIPLAPDLQKGECWCVAVVRSPALMEMFREKTTWALGVEEDAKRRQEILDNKPHQCARCGVTYCEKDNKQLPGSCSYHPCGVYEIVQGQDSPRLWLRDLVAIRKRQNEIAQDPELSKKVRMEWGCCLQAPGQNVGCRATLHTTAPSCAVEKSPYY